MSAKSLSIRIDSDMLDKLHVVADYEQRSANGQILVLIRDCIQHYEETQGEIDLAAVEIVKSRNKAAKEAAAKAAKEAKEEA